MHNGIIENYGAIKKPLIELGHTFKSETDTEVLVHLIEHYQMTDNLSLEAAVIKTLQKVVGAYAIVVMDNQNPDLIVGARKSSPSSLAWATRNCTSLPMPPHCKIHQKSGLPQR